MLVTLNRKQEAFPFPLSASRQETVDFASFVRVLAHFRPTDTKRSRDGAQQEPANSSTSKLKCQSGSVCPASASHWSTADPLLTLPLSVCSVAFQLYDQDRDGKISRAELLQVCNCSKGNNPGKVLQCFLLYLLQQGDSPDLLDHPPSQSDVMETRSSTGLVCVAAKRHHFKQSLSFTRNFLTCRSYWNCLVTMVTQVPELMFSCRPGRVSCLIRCIWQTVTMCSGLFVDPAVSERRRPGDTGLGWSRPSHTVTTT